MYYVPIHVLTQKSKHLSDAVCTINNERFFDSWLFMIYLTNVTEFCFNVLYIKLSLKISQLLSLLKNYALILYVC